MKARRTLKQSNVQTSPPRCRRGSWILLLTPVTRWGSWSWLEEIIKATPSETRWLVISYGQPDTKLPNVKYLTLPFINYAKLGILMSRPRWLALNMIFYLPLAPLALLAGAAIRPRVVIGNGLVASTILVPLKGLGSKHCLAFHGYTGHMGKQWDRLIKRSLKYCDVAFVNSPTSRDDLERVMDPERIVLVPHWADKEFFRLPLTRPAKARLTILFVGRLESEKFAQCLRVSKRLAIEGLVELWAVGTGSLQGALRPGQGLHHFGYVEDRAHLASIYGRADLVWAPADVTYLSRPGVEGLAAGCPLIVSDVPGVEVRARAGLRIARNLIPSDVGWVVDGQDDTEALSILRQLAAEGVSMERREVCRQYAQLYHREDNVNLVTREFASSP
jgi:glycosyltransferase involved in cell wall biosynthesis